MTSKLLWRKLLIGSSKLHIEVCKLVIASVLFDFCLFVTTSVGLLEDSPCFIHVLH